MHTSRTDALKAYLKLLEKNVASRADISLKEHFAQQLIANLPAGPATSSTYRLAVDATLESLPTEYKNDAVVVARELFPFLMSDVKTVAALMKSGGYRGFSASNTVIDKNNIKSMADLIGKSAAQAYASQRIALYDKYLACLRSSGTAASSVVMRGRIAKALLYLCRDNDVTPAHYRSAVDSVMPLLTKDEARFFLVLVAREFYHFLTMAPDAAGRINVSASYPSQDLFE